MIISVGQRHSYSISTPMYIREVVLKTASLFFSAHAQLNLTNMAMNNWKIWAKSLLTYLIVVSI